MSGFPSTPCNVTILSLSFFFFRPTKSLGICEATKDSSSASSKKRESKEHLEEPSGLESLPAELWHKCSLRSMQTLNWDTASVSSTCFTQGEASSLPFFLFYIACGGRYWFYCSHRAKHFVLPCMKFAVQIKSIKRVKIRAVKYIDLLSVRPLLGVRTDYMFNRYLVEICRGSTCSALCVCWRLQTALLIDDN